MKNFLLLSLLLAGCILASAQNASKNLSLVGQLSYPSTDLNDIWAYVDSNGHEYALVGLLDGVSIVDLSSDPTQPTEVQYLPGARSIWRDLKTFGHYAYVSNEEADGIRIIDLSQLPTAAPYKDTIIAGVETAHNLYIDEGFLYISGPNTYNGGVVILNLNVDPWRPWFAGAYDTHYVHDAYIRDNKAYLAEIEDGLLTIIDVSDKANPELLGYRTYQNAFTHNTWLSDDSTVCFTTDELGQAYIYSWDVTDPTDIKQLDRIRSSLSGGLATPHNVHVFNDFLVTSYYKDGIQIVDASRPTNLIEVGYYDTSPLQGGGTDGCWGAYPFLPSGMILATDQYEGLFVLQPTYQRGCFLEGKVTDANNGFNLINVDVKLLNTDVEDRTNNSGDYAIGTTDAGTYSAVFIKYGYLPDTAQVTLSNGNLTVLDVQLQPASVMSYSISVIDARTNQPIPDADVTAIAPGNAATFSYTADALGQVVDNAFLSGVYDVIAGKWGYKTTGINILADPNNTSLIIRLIPGYYDDFVFDNNWAVVGNATSGMWERGKPNGTDMFGNPANPYFDLSKDYGEQAFVTGNQAFARFEEDDVDNGTTVLMSPVMDLSSYVDPYLIYSWWLLNWDINQLRRGNDYLKVEITDGLVRQEVAYYDGAFLNRWNQEAPIRIKDYFPNPTATMKVIFTTEDAAPGNILEAAIDGFEVFDGVPVALDNPFELTADFNVFPNPVTGKAFTLAYDLPEWQGRGQLSFELYDLRGVKLAGHELQRFEDQLAIDFPYAHGLYLGVLKLNGKTIASRKVIK